MKDCWSSYYELNLTTKGFLSSCCVQDLEIFVDWNTVDDLEKWFCENETLNLTRRLMSDGVEIKECNACWEQESQGLKSRRFLKEYHHTGVVPAEKPSLRYLDLRLSNKCNLQCKMCTVTDSDQIYNLGIELKNKGITDLLYQPDIVTHNIPTKKLLNLVLNLPNLEFIRFAGGEPFIMPEVEDFLQQLIDSKKTHVMIEFITNCTTVKNSVLEKLKQFDSISIGASIDAIEDQFEYQRYPAKWSVVEKNFKKLYDCNFKYTNLTPCISMLNLTNIHNFMEWANQFPRASNIFNEVDTPTFLNFRHVPMSERTELIEAAKNIQSVNADKNWKIFLDKKIHEYKEPTEREKWRMKEFAEKIWNYKCNKKFLDAYPWAEIYY